jgi:hypothetical protein
MRIAILLASLAALAAAPAVEAAETITGKRAVRKATRLLQGKSLTTHESGSVVDNATRDRTAHLCRSKDLIVESTFVDTTTGTVQEDRFTGSWRVTRARMKGNRGRGRVRYRLDQGGGGSVTIVVDARGVYVGGLPTEVGRAEGCG